MSQKLLSILQWKIQSHKIFQKLIPYFMLGLGTLIISLSAIFVRHSGAPGTISSFYRMAIGSIVILPLFIIQIRNKKSLFSTRGILIAVFGGVFIGMDLTLWTTGIMLSGATIPTLMANTSPLWVGLGSLLFFRERLTLKYWVGLLIAIVGVMVILQKDLSISLDYGMGSILGLAAALFYAGYHMITQKGRNHLSTIYYFWIATFSATVFLFGLNLMLGHPFTGYTTTAYLDFIFLGVLVQSIGWILINYSQGYIPATIVVTILLGQPVLTAIHAWLLFDEALTFWHLLGGFIILIGIYIVLHSKFEKSAKENL